MLVFPEGRKGTEKLYKDRYRLRRFGRGGFVEAAMRAQGPDRPGRRRGRRGGDADLRPRQPRCRSSPASSTSRSRRASRGSAWPPASAYLPAKFRIRFLEPIPTDQWGEEPWNDKGLVQTVAEEVRGAHPGGALRDAGRAPVRVARVKRAPDHRALHLLGRPARPGARARRRTSRRSSASRPRTRRCELERTEFVRVGTQHALLRRIVHAARDRHRGRHPAVVDSRDRARARRPRAERDRDDEHPRGLRRPGLAGHARSSSSPPRTTTAASRTTRASSPRTCAARTRRRPGWSRTSSRPTTPSQGFAAAQPGRHGHHAALLQRPRARPADRPTPRCSACPPCPASSASTRATSSSTRTTSSARCTTRSSHELPGIHNAAPDGVLALSRDREPARQAVRAAAAALGHRPRRRAAQPRSACASPRRSASQLRYGRGLDNRRLKQSGYRFALTTRETVQAFAAALRLAATARERRRAVSLRARSGGIPALVAERAPRESSSPDAPATLAAVADRSARCRLPFGRSRMRTRLLVLAAFLAILALGGVAAAYFYDHAQARTRSPQGVKVNGVPIGGLTPRPGRGEALRRAARAARPARQGPLRPPHLHAHAEGGRVGIDIHGTVDKALARSQEGNMFSPLLAQPAQRADRTPSSPPTSPTTSAAIDKLVKRVQRKLNRRPRTPPLDLEQGSGRPDAPRSPAVRVKYNTLRQGPRADAARPAGSTVR